MAIFNSYVKLPEGRNTGCKLPCCWDLKPLSKFSGPRSAEALQLAAQFEIGVD